MGFGVDLTSNLISVIRKWTTAAAWNSCHFSVLSSGRVLQKGLVWIRCSVQREAISIVPGMSWFYCPFRAEGSKQGRLLGEAVVQVALVVRSLQGSQQLSASGADGLYCLKSSKCSQA